MFDSGSCGDENVPPVGHQSSKKKKLPPSQKRQRDPSSGESDFEPQVRGRKKQRSGVNTSKRGRTTPGKGAGRPLKSPPPPTRARSSSDGRTTPLSKGRKPSRPKKQSQKSQPTPQQRSTAMRQQIQKAERILGSPIRRSDSGGWSSHANPPVVVIFGVSEGTSTRMSKCYGMCNKALTPKAVEPHNIGFMRLGTFQVCI